MDDVKKLAAMHKKKIAIMFAEAIKKWVAIRDYKGIDEGRDNCPFCKEYDVLEYNGYECINTVGEKCPIAEHTGNTSCLYTPYTLWRDHQWNSHDHHKMAVEGADGYSRCGKCMTIATLEIDFLAGLARKYRRTTNTFGQKKMTK